MLEIKRGVTYWGSEGKRQLERRVNVIETRNSGKKYVNWTQIKKDGSEGKHHWTELGKFTEWVKGIYEIPDGQV